MIVLNIHSFGRYLLLKIFWSQTLLVLQLHIAIIICERITVLNLSLKTDYNHNNYLHFISTGSCAFIDVFNINFC